LRERDAIRDEPGHDRIRDEFLAILAHELRNRLAPIRSAINVLLGQDPVPGELRSSLDVIDRQTTQMARLVEDLLDVGRIARNELSLRTKRVKLSNVLREAFEISQPLIDEREHAFSISEPPRALYVEADRVRLAQAIANLLNNAAKYTEPGGRISLCAEQDGDDAVITVRDSGPGIPDELVPHLFEMFVHVDSPHESVPRGLGIGLTLVRRIVELHGGTVQANSEGAGRGSEFIARIPLAKQSTRRRQPRPEAAPDPAAERRVLIVDDNSDLAQSLAIMLESLGNAVRTAGDGAEALAIAGEFRPHAVALDVSLPTLSGYEVARQLRERWGREIALVAVTGWSENDMEQRAREAGFDRVLVKPVEAAALSKVFDSLVTSGPAR
jgi:CheY-like chemotaxis protein